MKVKKAKSLVSKVKKKVSKKMSKNEVFGHKVDYQTRQELALIGAAYILRVSYEMGIPVTKQALRKVNKTLEIDVPQTVFHMITLEKAAMARN